MSQSPSLLVVYAWPLSHLPLLRMLNPESLSPRHGDSVMKTKKMCDCGFPQSHPRPHEHSLPDKPQHTPAPWYVGESLRGITLYDADKLPLLGMNPNSDVDAAFIVKAVNCHEELVSALRAIRLRIQKGASILGSLEVVERAIAKAEGRP